MEVQSTQVQAVGRAVRYVAVLARAGREAQTVVLVALLVATVAAVLTMVMTMALVLAMVQAEIRPPQMEEMGEMDRGIQAV